MWILHTDRISNDHSVSKNISLKKILVILLSISCCSFSHGQISFKADANGEVHDGKFDALIASRGYQAVSAFDTVSKKPLLIYALYIKDNKIGILDISGKEITKPEFDEIPGLNKYYSPSMFGFHDHFTVQKGKQYGLIDQKGKLIIPVMYDYVSYRHIKNDKDHRIKRDSIFAATKGEKVFLFNTSGKLMGEEKEEVYEVTESSGEDRMLIDRLLDRKERGGQNKYGNIIRQSGKLAIVEAKVDGRYLQGAVNVKDDALIFPVTYNNIYIDRYNRLITVKDNLHMIYDSTGKRLMDSAYDRIEEFNGTYKIYKNKKMALYDRDLKALSGFDYDGRSGSANGEVMVLSKNGKFGLVGLSGKVMIDFLYDELHFFTFRNKKGIPFVLVTIDKKSALVSSDAKPLTGFDYDDIMPESGIYTGGGGGGGYEVAMPPDRYEYDESNNYFIVRIGRKFGLLNKSLKPLLPVEFDEISKAEYNDVVYTGRLSGSGYVTYGVFGIDKRDFILPIEFDGKIKCGAGKYFVVRKLNKYGLYNKNGKLVIPVEQANALYPEFEYKGMIMSKTRTDFYHIDYKGNVVHLKKTER